MPIDHHYPELKKHLEHIHQIGEKYNHLRDEIIKGGETLLKPIIENKYKIVDSEPLLNASLEENFQGSIALLQFSNVLAANIIKNYPKENLQIVRHRDNTVIAINDADKQQPRIVFQINPNNKDEEIILGCIEKFYSNVRIKAKAAEAVRAFSDFKNAIDVLRLDLVKISNKVILKTQKNFLFISCPYLQEHL